jgi:phosphomannomutase
MCVKIPTKPCGEKENSLMQKSPIKFGTDGWRAVIAEQFTFDNVEIVTRSIANYILERFGTEKPVVIGYDLRFLAETFAQHAAEILTEYGLNVQFSDTWHPTPVIAYVAREHDTAGAMMFTASHNPPEYLGIKFIPEYAGPALPDITDKIVANVRNYEANPDTVKSPAGVTKGKIETIYPRGEYIGFIKTLYKPEILAKAKGMKVLYDAIHGAGQGYVDTLLRECGMEVTTMRVGRDPLFGGTMPEPAEKYLPDLVRRVPEEGFALGLASDGDADRFGVVDEKGRFLIANEIVPMVFRHLYKNRGFRGSVVRSLATSKLLDRLAEVYGDVKVVETPVGFKWIGQAMREEPVIIGGEESGGFSVLGHIPEKDGVVAILLIVEMMAQEGKPLSEIFEDTIREAGMRFHNHYENYHLTEAQKTDIVAYLKALKPGQDFNGLTIQSVDHRDGVKLYFDTYDWVVVRPSGTEPLLRTYLESTEAEKLNTIRKGLEQVFSREPVLQS